jgi:ATP-dependent RNA helicase DDX23/PRP28
MCASLRPNDKVIVFVNEKKSAEKVARTIEKNGKKTVVLHGGKAQDLREQSLAQFKEGGRILVATDVAGRGIDVADVTHVVNYDVPTKIDNYCHRIGRTGRAGKSGIAVSFLTDSDTEIMPALLKYLKDTKSYVPEKLSRNKVCGGDSDTHFMK